MFKRKKNGGTQKRSTIVDSETSSSDSDSSRDFSSRVKRSKSNPLKTSTASTAKISAPDYSSTIDHSHSKQLAKTDEATKESILHAKDPITESGNFSAAGPYKVDFQKPTQPGSLSVGLKSASNIKSTTSQDYQPDVCKDYKLTGFCGYGDSCKFLHMREDYKAGWQIDREWEIGGGKTESRDQGEGKGQGQGKCSESRDQGKAGDVPSTCPICDKNFTSPVVTQCGHYFCEKCFLTKHKKKQNCFVCGVNTKGVCKPFKG